MGTLTVPGVYIKEVESKKVFPFQTNIAGFVGIVGLFFAASGFASSLRTILNKVRSFHDVNVMVIFTTNPLNAAHK